jgi:hypothetical protein
MKASKLRCENCPARNAGVRRVKFDGRRMNLCARCIVAATAPARELPAVPVPVVLSPPLPKKVPWWRRVFMFFAMFFALSSIAIAQTVPLPNWAGMGAAYGPSGSPKTGGWAALALPVSQSQSLYSYSLYSAVPVKGTVPTISTTTGLATVLRTYKVSDRGLIYVLGLVTAGVATTSTATGVGVFSAATVGAFSGGGLAIWKFPNGITLEAGATADKAGPTSASYKLGLGKTW